MITTQIKTITKHLEPRRLEFRETNPNGYRQYEFLNPEKHWNLDEILLHCFASLLPQHEYNYLWSSPNIHAMMEELGESDFERLCTLILIHGHSVVVYSNLIQD